MSENNCILQPEQYNFLWKTSFLSLFSSLYGIYKGHNDISYSTFAVFLSSINYWKKPNYSWRRYLDITVVNISLIYHLLRAQNSQYSKLYYSTLFTSICFYPLSKYYYNKKLYWYSTYSHSMLHLLANISNIILYSGFISPKYSILK